MDPVRIDRCCEIFGQALVITVLSIACEAAAQAPPQPRPAVIKLIEQVPDARLRGTVATAETTLDFDIQVDRSAGRRMAEVKRGGETLARLVGDPETRTPRVELRGMRWRAGESIAPAQLERVGEFTDSPEGRALRELAIHLPDVAPAIEYKVLRLTLLELYAEIARFSTRRPPPFTGRLLPQERKELLDDEARCAGSTEDALFDCEDQEGFEPVVPFLDDRSPAFEQQAAPGAAPMRHDAGGCYGACGPGCSERVSQFVSVPVRCAADAPPPPRGAKVCAEPEGGATPPYRPKSDLQVGAPPCLDAIESGRLLVGTTAPCCFAHDDCNRHDRGRSYLKCQLWGMRECGFQAVYGLPPNGWSLKWFTRGGYPVALAELPSEAGLCTSGTNPQPIWTEPPVIPHDQEQVLCPIHGVKH